MSDDTEDLRDDLQRTKHRVSRLEGSMRSIADLSVGFTGYQEMVFLFLPNEWEEFNTSLKRLGENVEIAEIHMGSIEDFEDLFDTLVRVKQLPNIHSSAQALRVMVKLANDHLDVLDELEAEEDG